VFFGKGVRFVNRKSQKLGDLSEALRKSSRPARAANSPAALAAIFVIYSSSLSNNQFRRARAKVSTRKLEKPDANRSPERSRRGAAPASFK
jgi:hypothetical protein